MRNDFRTEFLLSGPAAATDLHGSDGAPPQRTIGEIIRKARDLTLEQVDKIVHHQRERGIRFGEAAVALKLASRDDVLWALSQQFHYPYAAASGRNFNGELIAAIDPFDPQTEAVRGVRSQLLQGSMAPGQPRRALSILSPDVGDGKSFVAANLAIVFSQLGSRTLLIDGDMRTPRQHLLFGVPNDVGLSSVLAGRRQASAIHSIEDLPSLFVMPVGTLPPNPLELLQHNNFDLLVHELLGKFEYIVVDTPAPSHGADCRVLASKCGLAMAIGRRDRSRVHAINGLITQVTRGSVEFAGVLINDH